MKTEEIFAEKTTYKYDYTVPELIEQKRCKIWSVDPKTPTKIIRQKPYEPIDLQTFRRWNDPYNKVPMDLYWERKDIVRTHPKLKFGKIDKGEDLLKDDVIKTRPRLYLSPAVSMDDIPEKEIRDLLVDYMYCTVFEQATKQSNPKFNKREIPDCTFEKRPNQLKGNYYVFTPIPPHLREKGPAWEREQYSSLVNPEKQFWQNYEHKLNAPVGRDIYEKTVTAEDRKEIRELIGKEELRLSCDKPTLGYGGYSPTNVSGTFRKLKPDRREYL